MRAQQQKHHQWKRTLCASGFGLSGVTNISIISCCSCRDFFNLLFFYLLTCETLLSQSRFHKLCGPIIGSTIVPCCLELLAQIRHCVSYPDHLDLNSILEKIPDLGCYFLPGFSHRSQPLQLFKCGICLETAQNLCKPICVLVHYYTPLFYLQNLIFVIMKTYLSRK